MTPKHSHRPTIAWLLLAVLAGVCAVGCRSLVPQYASPLPRVLPPSPNLNQVVQVVNANSAGIQSFFCPRATLSSPDFPTLRAVVAYQRPKRFRLRAETALTGPEFDLGSNDELFWFWVRRNDPPALYFCRHGQFAQSPARNMVPIEPEWLIEALGIAHFDPGLPQQGPYPLPGDRVEIRTILETPQGPHTKVTILDSVRGCLLQQSLYDAQGRVVVSADLAMHTRDPLTGLVMPRIVNVRSLPYKFAMQIDLGNVEINRLGPQSGEMWSVPQYADSPMVDLANPRFAVPQATGQGARYRVQGAGNR